MVSFVGVDNGIGHVACLSPNWHFVRFVAAGSQNRSSIRENSGKHIAVDFYMAVVAESVEAVFKSQELHIEIADSRFADSADRGVQTGAIAPACEDADVFCHGA